MKQAALEPVRYLDEPPAGAPEPLEALPDFLDQLETGDPAPDPGAAAAAAVDPKRFVPIEQFQEQVEKNKRYEALGPIADELARNPALAENLRRQLINGDVAPQPFVQPTQPVPIPQMSEEQKQTFLSEFYANPQLAIAKIALPLANVIADQKIGVVTAQTSSQALRLFNSAKVAENADEFAAAKPYFEEALKGVDLATIPGAALDHFLKISYDASAAQAYRAAAGAGTPLAVRQAAEHKEDVPPYGGAQGAVARAATASITRAASAQPQRGGAEVTGMIGDLARRSGLTQADIKKYGARIDDSGMSA